MKNKIIDVLKNIGLSLLILSCATALGVLFRMWEFPETNVVVVYVFSTLLIARFTKGYVYGILSSVSEIALFNWFFTEPYFTLKVNDPTYSITFIVMTVTALITSTLTTKVKEIAIESQKKEEESNILYRMTNLLTNATDNLSIGRITVKTISSILSCNAAIVCYDDDGNPEELFIQQKDDNQFLRKLENKEEFKSRVKHLEKYYFIDSEFYNYPINGSDKTLAVLRIPKERGDEISDEQIRLLHSVIENTSLAMDRLNSIHNQNKIKEEATKERYRGNLLRAISHDLRTPLSGIMGSSEILMGMTDKEDPRYDIADGIHKDADWLHSLVENILNLTKLQDGKLVLDRTPEALEEVVASAIMVIGKRAPEREINVSIPDNFIMVPMDGRLICQVLVNLLDNAIKHTPEDKEICLSAKIDDENKNLIFSVADKGTGIKESDLPSVFQMFYTTRAKCADSQRGMGLGLSICQSIVEAHGGKISVHNRKEGGAEFTFNLPLEVQKKSE